MTEPDKRQIPRKSLCQRAHIISVGKNSSMVRTADISMGGVCMMTPELLPVGSFCLSILDLPMGEGFHEMYVRTQVVNSCPVTGGFRTGMRFLDVDGGSTSAISHYLGN